MKRSAIAVLIFPLLLAACSSSSAIVCKQQYWDGTIGLCLPTGWTVMDRETLTRRGAPADVVTAFQHDAAVAGQFPTITVTREPVQAGVDSTAYSKASIRSVAELPNYKLIDTRDMRIDGKPVQLHIFSAKPHADEPERRFYQLSGVGANQIGYTFTALTPFAVNSSLESEITAAMSAATFVDATAVKK